MEKSEYFGWRSGKVLLKLTLLGNVFVLNIMFVQSYLMFINVLKTLAQKCYLYIVCEIFYFWKVLNVHLMVFKCYYLFQNVLRIAAILVMQVLIFFCLKE